MFRSNVRFILAYFTDHKVKSTFSFDIRVFNYPKSFTSLVLIKFLLCKAHAVNFCFRLCCEHSIFFYLATSLNLNENLKIILSILDIDECADPSISARCVENAECCNLPAHFLCKCKAGFEGDGEEYCAGEFSFIDYKLRINSLSQLKLRIGHINLKLLERKNRTDLHMTLLN